MSLEIILQEIKLFGKLLPHHNLPESQPIDEQRRFRVTFGDKTYTSKNPGFFISPNQLAFDEPFSVFYDNRSIVLHLEIFPPHEPFNNRDLQETLFAEFDFSDISNVMGDCLQTSVYNIEDQAVGKVTTVIQVFKKGPRFIDKVTSKVLFETVKEEKQRQIKASPTSKNIKKIMVNNTLTNTLMTIHYLQIKPQKQDPQIFNRQTFIMVRYGPSKAFSKIVKVLSKQNVQWNEYLEFMENDDVKFEFYFLFYDDLGSLVCKAKGEIKYIVFDETINNHTIVMFDRKSTIYGNLLVKFVEKEVEVVNIHNKVDKRLKQEQPKILQSIQEFNRFKFESRNNNRILSQKLRQMQLKQLEQEQEKSKPLDAQQKKKKEQHSRFIQFLQKEVIKIQRELKKREIEEKRDQRKVMYQATNHPSEKMKDKKFNVSMSSMQFQEEGLARIEEIDESHIVPENVREDQT